MVRVHGTNIHIDEFSVGRRNPYQHFIYFLTHCHSDHMTGLNPSWDFGTIYCSAITKRILLNKLPNIKNVIALELNTAHTIYLNESKSLYIVVTLLDANHCLGSVMILMQGYMGNVLHTGDFRYTPLMLEDSPTLFPGFLKNNDNWKCSIHIDELILDNTYCDPVFQFPTRKEAFDMIVQIMNENRDKDRVLIAIDNLGKEEMLIELSNVFETLIVVNETRYSTLQAIGLHVDKFTTNPDEGFIEVIRKTQIEEKLIKYPNSFCITATGWVNQPVVRAKSGRSYIVSYSLHSNFREMETFVRCIQPGKITPIERNRNTTNKLEDLVEHGVFALRKLKQKGLDKLIDAYTDIKSLSPEYRSLENQENWERIMEELGFELQNATITKPEQKKQFNTREFERRHPNIFGPKKKVKPGAKIYSLESNPFLNQNEKAKIQRASTDLMDEEIYRGQTKEQIMASIIDDIDSTYTRSQDEMSEKPMYDLSQVLSQSEQRPFFYLPPSSLSALSQAMEKRKLLQDIPEKVVEEPIETRFTPDFKMKMDSISFYKTSNRKAMHDEDNNEGDHFRLMARAELLFNSEASIPLEDIENPILSPRQELITSVSVSVVEQPVLKKKISTKRKKKEEKQNEIINSRDNQMENEDSKNSTKSNKNSRANDVSPTPKNVTNRKKNVKKEKEKEKGQTTIDSYFCKPRIVTADTYMQQQQSNTNSVNQQPQTYCNAQQISSSYDQSSFNPSSSMLNKENCNSLTESKVPSSFVGKEQYFYQLMNQLEGHSGNFPQ